MEEGFELEARIHFLLCGVVPIMRENTIKKHYGDQSLNGVDHLIVHGNTMISIQDKWKQSIGQQEMSQFIDCTTRLIKLNPSVKFCTTILVAKTKPTANAIKTLEDKHTVILINNDMKMLSMMCALKVAEILGISAEGIVFKSPYCGLIPMTTEEGITKLEKIKSKTPAEYLHVFKQFMDAQMFNENEFNFQIYKCTKFS